MPSGWCSRSSVASIWVKPKTAFVSWPVRVTMSRGMAKNAR